jgi:hypothetical protein
MENSVVLVRTQGRIAGNHLYLTDSHDNVFNSGFADQIFFKFIPLFRFAAREFGCHDKWFVGLSFPTNSMFWPLPNVLLLDGTLSVYLRSAPSNKQDGQCTYNVILRRVRVAIVAVESNKCYVFRVCVAIVIQRAKCLRCICYHLYPVWLYNIFPRYLRNCTIFEKLLYTKCVLTFSTAFVWNIYLFKNNSAIYIGLHVKYSLFVSDFSETWISSIDFREVLEYQISWKSVHWELSCSKRVAGQMDRQTWRN